MKLKTKIQLYILPLLLGLLIVSLYDNVFKTKQLKPVKAIRILNKKFEGNYVDLFSNIEKFAYSNNIKIINISKKKNRIILHVNSTLYKSFKLIQYLENLNNFTKIGKIILNKKDKKYIYEIDISLNKYYEKELKKIVYRLERETPEFKLNAIIGSFVFINNKLINIKDEVNGFILEKINCNYIVLKKGNKTIKLEVFNEKTK